MLLPLCDLPNLRKWEVMVKTLNPANFNVWKAKPNSGVTMHQKVLTMFRPPTGKVYNIGNTSFTANGFLMAYCSGIYIYSRIANRLIGAGGLLKGIGIEENRANDEINLRTFEATPVEVAMFVFHNDLG